jgi:hypothetical protein
MKNHDNLIFCCQGPESETTTLPLLFEGQKDKKMETGGSTAGGNT